MIKMTVKLKVIKCLNNRDKRWATAYVMGVVFEGPYSPSTTSQIFSSYFRFISCTIFLKNAFRLFFWAIRILRYFLLFAPLLSLFCVPLDMSFTVHLLLSFVSLISFSLYFRFFYHSVFIPLILYYPNVILFLSVFFTGVWHNCECRLARGLGWQFLMPWLLLSSTMSSAAQSTCSRGRSTIIATRRCAWVSSRLQIRQSRWVISSAGMSTTFSFHTYACTWLPQYDDNYGVVRRI